MFPRFVLLIFFVLSFSLFIPYDVDRLMRPQGEPAPKARPTGASSYKLFVEGFRGEDGQRHRVGFEDFVLVPLEEGLFV